MADSPETLGESLSRRPQNLSKPPKSSHFSERLPLCGAGLRKGTTVAAVGV